jgi:hypothetical protein
VQCLFKIRKDDWQGRDDKLKHVCIWREEKIADYFREGDDSDEAHCRTKLDEAIYFLCAHHNLSFSLIASKEMKEVISSAIGLGQKNFHINPRDIYSTGSRNTFRKRFMAKEAQKSSAILEQYKAFQCSAIAMDGGSIKSRPFLTINLINSCLSLRRDVSPFPLILIAEFQGTRNSYLEAILMAENEMTQMGIRLCALVGDNLSVQMGAMKSYLGCDGRDQSLPGMVVSPCACHTLALAFNDCANVDESLGTICQSLKRAAELLRSKPVASRLALICPSFCPTRWNHVFHIAEYIIRNAVTIMNFIEENASIIPSDVAGDLLQCIMFHAPVAVIGLAYLSAATRILEADNCPAAQIPLVIRHCCLNARELRKQTGMDIPFLEELESAIGNRFESGDYALLHYVMFSLIPEGRNAIRKSFLSHLYAVQTGLEGIRFNSYSLTLSNEELDVVALVRLNLRMNMEIGTHVGETIKQERSGFSLGTEFGQSAFRRGFVNTEQWNWVLSQRRKPHERIFPYYDDLSDSECLTGSSDDDLGDLVTRVQEPAIVQVPASGHTARKRLDTEGGCLDWDYVSSGIGGPKLDTAIRISDAERLQNEQTWRAEFAMKEPDKSCFAEICFPIWLTLDHLKDGVLENASLMKLNPNAVLEQWKFWIEDTFPLGGADIDCQLFDEPWRKFSDNNTATDLVAFALNLLAVPASEACCERSIGQERDIFGDHRYSLSKETLLSQLRSGSTKRISK